MVCSGYQPVTLIVFSLCIQVRDKGYSDSFWMCQNLCARMKAKLRLAAVVERGEIAEVAAGTSGGLQRAVYASMLAPRAGSVPFLEVEVCLAGPPVLRQRWPRACEWPAYPLRPCLHRSVGQEAARRISPGTGRRMPGWDKQAGVPWCHPSLGKGLCGHLVSLSALNQSDRGRKASCGGHGREARGARRYQTLPC